MLISRRNLLMAGALLGTTGGLMSGRALAQKTWPVRPVRFIVPLAPGGAIDFVARQCAQPMTVEFGQQVFVENRTGAGGTIGMDAAMKAAPDGYTILITNDNAASAPHILKLNYDYTKVMLPVIDLAHQPQVFAVHPSLGVNSVADYVAYAKKNPGLGFASSGVGSNQHVIGEWFAKEAGLRLEHVPYRGAGQAVGDLLAGHVKSAFLGPTALIGHHKSGAIKIIAQSSGKRSPTLQDVPTLKESGYDVELEAWYAAFAPPGTPAELIEHINATFQHTLKDAKLMENFEKGSLEAIGGAPDKLGQLARADSEKYARLVKELKISAG